MEKMELKSQKLKLLQIKKIKNQISSLAPKYKQFIEYMRTDEKTYLVTAGGRSGAKGTTVQWEIIFNLYEERNYAMIYSPKCKSIRKGVYAQIKKTISMINSELQKENIRNVDGSLFQIKYEATVSPFNIKFTNGSEIHFDGLVDGQKGTTSDDIKILYKYIVFEELAELKTTEDPSPMISEVLNTFLKDKTQIVFVGNPPRNKFHWFHGLINKYSEMKAGYSLSVNCHDIPREWNDNKFWDLEDWTKTNDYKQWEHEYCGKAVGISGLMFTMWNESKMVLDSIPDDWKPLSSFVGVDYGELNATTFGYDVLYETADKTIVTVEVSSWYYSGKDNVQLGPSKYAEEFKKWITELMKQYPVPQSIWYDPSAKGLAIEIRNATNYHLTKANNSRVEGWQMLKNLMINDRMFVLKNGDYKSFVWEIERCEYDKNTIEKSHSKGEDIDKVNDHCLDRKRYSVAGYYRFFKDLRNVYNLGDEDENKK